MKFSTLAIHSGQSADKSTGATIVPIYQTSTFTQQAIGKHLGYEYSRSGNPTRTALETCLASLENGKHAMAFASGLAANMAILSILSPEDEIVAIDDLYGGSYRIFEKILRPLGIRAKYVRGDDLRELESAITGKVKLIWAESPTNPLLKLVDIEAAAGIAKKKGVLFAVDNTFATPVAQNPLNLGADIVVHSTTKYIAGHSDTIGGAVVLNDPELFEKISFYQNAAGGVPSAFDSWLVLRGIKTLSVRMERHEQNALKVAEFLEGRREALSVNYPSLKSHPQSLLAKRQMRNFGGMLSFEISGGKEAAEKFISQLKIFSLAESLGGVESLVSVPAFMTHASIPEKERVKRGISNGLIRLSVGIEDIDDIIGDLKSAFGAMGK